MFGAILTSLFLFPVNQPPNLPPSIDPQIAQYYSRALASAAEGENQKAMGMLKLLLIPEDTSVSLDLSRIPSGDRPRVRQALIQGFELWRSALPNDFPFRLTPDDPEAPVQIRVIPASIGPSGNCMGEIRATRKVQWNRFVHYVEFTATIDVAYQSSEQRSLSSEEFVHVVGHELGHALGLGDSNLSNRIMGPVVLGNPFARIHEEELNAVRAFRQILREQLERIQKTLKNPSPPSLLVTP